MNPNKINIKNSDLEEDLIKQLIKKYPNAYVPNHDEKTGLPILPKSEHEDWEY